jgi:hypothetical protein
MKDAQHEWEVGLSSWIIQDGNYDNLATRQVVEFALKFYSQTYRQSDMRTKSVKSLGAAKYEIIGEARHLAGVYTCNPFTALS